MLRKYCILIIIIILLLLCSCKSEEELPIITSESEIITYVNSEGIGNIAIMIQLPETSRYEDGAPVIIRVKPYMTNDNKDFEREEWAVDVGFIQISYLWPGKGDLSGVESEGIFDYGGENCLQALKDVTLFTLGKKEDIYGNNINDFGMDVLTNNIGLYAFSHPGIATVNTLSIYNNELQDVAYFVGRENPTIDKIFAMELGYHDGEEVKNPYYSYPESYSSYDLDIDYSTVNYDAEEDRIYLDDNYNGKYDDEEFMSGFAGPRINDVRFHSVDLVKALAKNVEKWPDKIANLELVEEFWILRESVPYFEGLNNNLKVMLVFAKEDHVQPTIDNPNVHQAYDGCKRAGLWVRLNPDDSYLDELSEHDANTEPEDWLKIKEWAYPNSINPELVAKGAIEEMADRTYYNNWENDLDERLS